MEGRGHRYRAPAAQAAAQLVGERVPALVGGCPANPPQHLDRLVARLPPIDVLVEQDRLDDLIADRVDRTERGHRFLEDERDLRPADRAHLRAVRRELRQVDHLAAPRPAVGGRTTKLDLAIDDPARPIDDSEDRSGPDALAAAALADDAEGRPR